MSLTPKELEIQERCEMIVPDFREERVLQLLELLSTVSALREEVERLEKALDQAVKLAPIKLCGPMMVIGGYHDSRNHDNSTAPELAAYLRKRSEAKQAEQTATQPASTNQEDGEEL